MNQQVSMDPVSDTDTAVKSMFNKFAMVTRSQPPQEVFALMQYVKQFVESRPPKELITNRWLTLLFLGYASIPLRPFINGMPGTPTYDPQWLERTDEFAMWRIISEKYPDFQYDQQAAARNAQGLVFAQPGVMGQPQNFIQPQQQMMPNPMMVNQGYMMGQPQQGMMRSGNVPSLDMMTGPTGGF